MTPEKIAELFDLTRQHSGLYWGEASHRQRKHALRFARLVAIEILGEVEDLVSDYHAGREQSPPDLVAGEQLAVAQIALDLRELRAQYEGREQEVKRGGYGWSPAYEDVLKLRREADRLRRELVQMSEQYTEDDARGNDIRNLNVELEKTKAERDAMRAKLERLEGYWRQDVSEYEDEAAALTKRAVSAERERDAALAELATIKANLGEGLYDQMQHILHGETSLVQERDAALAKLEQVREWRERDDDDRRPGDLDAILDSEPAQPERHMTLWVIEQSNGPGWFPRPWDCHGSEESARKALQSRLRMTPDYKLRVARYELGHEAKDLANGHTWRDLYRRAEAECEELQAKLERVRGWVDKTFARKSGRELRMILDS
jgi:hypothetical protein